MSDRTIGRLSLYRRLLSVLEAEGVRSVFSRELAARAGCTAVQVRRDLMAVGFHGSSAHGYDAARLAESIRQVLDVPGGMGMILVGVGNLGRALLAYFAGRPHLRIAATFDVDPAKVHRVISGCRCWPVDRMTEVLAGKGVHVAILTVPAEAAQAAADQVARAGVRGILNFAPVRLRVPPGVYVEDIDMSVSLEKVAYYAHRGAASAKKG